MQEKCFICKMGKGPICESCFENFKRNEADMKLKYVDELLALFSYDGILKDIMFDFKFAKSYSWGKVLGQVMYKESKSKGLDIKDYDLVTFIPTDPFRFLKRGFNQAKLLAQAFATCAGLPCKSTMYRSGLQKESHKMEGDLRSKVNHNFKAKTSGLKGVKRVIIIDDIITTGQTISEAAKCIKLATDARVTALSLLGDF